MFGFSPGKLALVLVIMLIVFGPGKLPQVGDALGKAVQGFREAQEGEEGTEEAPGDKK